MKPPFRNLAKPKTAANNPASAAVQAKLKQGLALHQKGRLALAQELYQQVLTIHPRHFDALILMGVIARQTNNFLQAIELIDRAIEINPNNAAAYNNRGNALQALKRHDEALECYERALKIKPDFGEALNNRGNVLQDLKRHDEALESFDRALKIKPDYAAVLNNNRGNALKELKRHDEALESYERALKTKPDFAEALNNRGFTLQKLKRHDEALESYERALKIKPDYAEALNNLGIALQDLKRHDEALECYERALKIKPDYAEAHWNLSLCRLLMGDFARGWEGYEWGWESEKRGKTKSRLAKDWDGKVLKGSLLVLPEQGVGDVIFYSGMLNDLQSRAESITVCVDPRLVKLYERSFANMTFVSKVTLGLGQYFDSQVYMASLGRYFRESISALENIKVPYLRACVDSVEKLRSQLKDDERLVCGLSWVSKHPDFGADKSLSLKALMPVLRLASVDFVDLQYGDTNAEQSELCAETGIRLKRIAEIDNFNDIDNLAALIEACDLVVTVSNTTAHLAAALGKPVFVMLPFSAGLLWYWHIDRKECFWYPNARLFRQDRIGDWASVIDRVRTELQNWPQEPEQNDLVPLLKDTLNSSC